jgi:long-chain acyl-CoA synthetase
MKHARVTNLYEHIATLARSSPEKVALLSSDEEGAIVARRTYTQLQKELGAAAGYLRGLNLKRGDRVALALKNSPELLVLSWAAWASGIVTVPLDTKRDTIEQYQYKMKLNGAKILIAHGDVLRSEAPLPGVVAEIFSGFPEDASFSDWESGSAHRALVLFTSGTTGHPRGALLSLENLLVNADGIKEWLHFKSDDTFLVNLPLHHINSTTFCLSTLLAGGTVAIIPGYSNSHFWRQVAGTGATVTSIVQSILFDQLRREEEFAAVKKEVKLTRIQIGSAPVIAQSVEEFTSTFGIPLYQGYGQTETALRVTGVPMGLKKELYQQLMEENSIGIALPWADLRISDDEGNFLGEGEEGELVVKGAAIMEGYVAGEPAFRNGYFLTGDIGYFKVIDGQKYYYLKGRKREIIIKGGINISPISVENALNKISADIEQVHVVAVPDERYGEEAGAVISWKEGVDEQTAKRRLKLTLLMGTPHLSAYETPKYLTSFLLSELPMTSTGKVQRSILKQMLPYERFESIFGLFKTHACRFTVLHRHSRWVQSSYDLYKQCWGKLAPKQLQYEKDIQKHLIIMAVDTDDRILGQIAVVRTSRTSEELLKTHYDELLMPGVLDREGNALVCVSICSADYKEKPIPVVKGVISDTDVLAYLKGGHDPVMRFHEKAKGGQQSGAELIGLIRGGRPDDTSSLGYNMLLKYPRPQHSSVSEDAPVSQQLIEMALRIAEDLGLKDVYAFSRPGGLAAYLAQR